MSGGKGVGSGKMNRKYNVSTQPMVAESSEIGILAAGVSGHNKYTGLFAGLVRYFGTLLRLSEPYLFNCVFSLIRCSSV